jgi:hypothetical protein
MNATPKVSSLKRMILFILMLVFTLTACGRAERNPDGGIDVPVNLSEQQVTDAIARVLAEGENPLLRNPQVDFQTGVIVINGEHQQRDGSGTVQGTLKANAGASDGALTITITDIQIEAYSADETQIADYNRRIAEALIRLANELPNVRVLSATVTDTELQLVINATRRG